MAVDFFPLIFQLESFDAAENMTHFIRAAFRQQGHEFIATKANCEIGASNGALQPFRESLDHEVARRVTKPVIYGFQFIQVQKQDRQGTAMALRAADFLCKPLLAGAAVVKTRELIESS
jgi:hypothetical protein